MERSLQFSGAVPGTGDLQTCSIPRCNQPPRQQGSGYGSCGCDRGAWADTAPALTPRSLSQGGTTLPERAFPYMRLEKGAFDGHFYSE